MGWWVRGGCGATGRKGEVGREKGWGRRSPVLQQDTTATSSQWAESPRGFLPRPGKEASICYVSGTQHRADGPAKINMQSRPL